MAAGVSAPLYTREILRLAASLVEPGGLDRVDGEVERRSPTCGSQISVAVMLDEGKVTALSQRVEACAFGQAATALMVAAAPGKTGEEIDIALAGIERWLKGEDDAVTAWPGLAVLEPARSRVGRHQAILLPFAALLGAIEAAR